MRNTALSRWQRDARPHGIILAAPAAAILAGAAVGLQDIRIALLLAAPGVLTVLALHPQIGLFGIFLGVYSLDWLSRVLGVLPTQVRWLPDLVLIFVFALSVLGRLRQRRLLSRTPIDLPALGFLVLGVLSFVVNGVPVQIALAGFRNVLKPFVLFYCIANLDARRRTLKRLMWFIFGLELSQIAITLMQLQVYSNWDFVGGTLGYKATGIGAIVALMFMSLFYGLAVSVERGWRYGILGSALFVPVLLGEGKVAFFLGPPAMVFLIGRELPRSLSKVLLILVAFVAAYAASLVVAPMVIPGSRIVDFLTSPERILDTGYERPLSATGIPQSRLGDLQFAFRLATRGLRTFVIGYGPGETAPSYFDALAGRLFRQHGYAGDFFGYLQLSRTLLEWGAAGLLLYLLTIYQAYRLSERLLSVPSLEPFWRGIAIGFRGMVVVMVSSTIYWRVWETDAIAYVFWASAAVLCSVYRSAASPINVALERTPVPPPVSSGARLLGSANDRTTQEGGRACDQEHERRQSHHLHAQSCRDPGMLPRICC